VGSHICTLGIGANPRQALISWQPSPPDRLGAAELQQYRAGRDKAVREAAAVLGLKVGVVDL